MRGLIISTASFLLILFIWSGFFLNMKSSSADLLKQIDNALVPKIAEEDWQFAKTSLEYIIEEWDKDKFVYSIFANHTSIATIDISFAKLSSYISSNEQTLSYSEIAAIKENFDLFEKSEALTVDNLF